MEIYESKVPKERIAVLIGTKGETRREIEKKLNVKIIINSDTGDVSISGESVNAYITKQIVIAIGRGFNPELALSLMDDENSIEIIDITSYARNKNNLVRVRSRVIGTKGRVRTLLEQLSDSHISVYGKTVSILGRTENVLLAKRAVETLLRGSKHGNVYAMLEESKKLQEDI